MKIVIGTTSELKIRALKKALGKLNIDCDVISVKTESGVSNQPFGYEETTKGAKNRTVEAFKKQDSDIALGVESGLIEIEGNYFDIACVYAKTLDGISISYSCGYFVPNWIVDEIKKENTELGYITQRLSGGDPEKDGIKYFSGDKIKREELLSQAIEVALIKILNKEKYKKI